VTLETLSEHDSEEESEENNELLIEEMMRKKNDEHKDSQVEDGLNQDNETSSDMVMDGQSHQNPSPKSEGQECRMTNEGIGREDCDNSVDTGKNVLGKEEKALIMHTPVTSVWKNLSMFAPGTPCVSNELVCSVGDPGKTRLGISSYESILSKEVWPPLI
jgi:hypothetical protein